jgi:hypothetical protein
MREVCQLAGPDGMFSSIVFGSCPQTRVLRAFRLDPVIEGASFRVDIQERALSAIRSGGTAAKAAIIIGSSPGILAATIDDQLADAKQRGEVHDLVAFDAPKRALRKLISEGADERVGGSIQQAWATAAEFEIISNVEPITPRLCEAGLGQPIGKHVLNAHMRPNQVRENE